MQKLVGAAPSNTADATPRSYVDGQASAPGTPSGWWWDAPAISTGQSIPPQNTTTYVPLYIPWRQAWSAIGVHVTTLLSGGTTVTTQLAVYPLTSSGILDWANPIESGTVDLSSAGGTVGKHKYTFPSSRTLAPGTYWLGFLYSFTGTLGATPALNVVTNNPMQMPHPDTVGIGNIARGWRATSQTSFPTSQPGTLTTSSTSDVPCIGLQAA